MNSIQYNFQQSNLLPDNLTVIYLPYVKMMQNNMKKRKIYMPKNFVVMDCFCKYISIWLFTGL